MRKFNTVGGGARTNVNGLEFEARTHLYEAIEKHPDFIVDGNEIKKNNITVAYYYEKNSLYKKLLEVKGVISVHHIHIWGISTNENALTAHVVFDNLQKLPQIKASLKEELEEHNINHSTLEFEIVEENCTETTL